MYPDFVWQNFLNPAIQVLQKLKASGVQCLVDPQ